MKRYVMSKKTVISLLAITAMIICTVVFFNISVAASESNQFVIDLNSIPTYTGESIEIEPCVSVDGRLLVKDVDYVLSYENNVMASCNAKVFVDGINEYEGYYSEMEFPIQKASINNASVRVDDVTYTSGALIPYLEVSLNGNFLISGVDYSVQYIDNLHVGYGTVRIIGVGNYSGHKDTQFRILESTNNYMTLSSSIMYVPSGTTFSGSVRVDGQVTEGSVEVRHTPFGSYQSSTDRDSSDGYYYFTCTEAGTYSVKMNLKARVYKGFDVSTGRHQYTVETYTFNYTIYCDAHTREATISAGVPVVYGTNTAYLHVEGNISGYAVCDPAWASSNTGVATVDNGIVTFHKSGNVTITATVGGKTVTWNMNNTPLDISRNSDIIYDEGIGSYIVVWKNEILRKNTDYTITVEERGDYSIVVVTGKNLFGKSYLQLFYSGTNITYTCPHDYSNWETAGAENHKRVCTICLNEERASHIYDEWEDMGNGYHAGVCTVCQYEKENSHVFTNYVSNNNATCTSNGTKTATCDFCSATTTRTDYGSMLDHTFNGELIPIALGEYSQSCECGLTKIVSLTGWNDWNGNRYYIYNDKSLAVYWFEMGNSKYYFNASGEMQTGWEKIEGKWYFFESDGKMVSGCWRKDSTGWCYLSSDGYMLTNKWVKDSIGWCYVGANGYMVYNKWVKDSIGWCHVGTNGYMEYNKWVKDSKGWCHVGSNGYMEYNKWVKDSVGWCHVGYDGYMEYNKWVKDSVGWCYVGSSGYMVTNAWVSFGGQWYYMNGSGYMVTGRQLIGGKYYTFNSSGVWVG